MPRVDPLELRTVAEVQAATGLTFYGVQRAISRGELHAVFVGLNPHVPKVELDRYVAEHEQRRGA